MFCADGICVEVRFADGCVEVRDSKLGDSSPVFRYTTGAWRWLLASIEAENARVVQHQVDGSIVWRRFLDDDAERLRFTPDEWRAFVGGVKAGDFTLARILDGYSTPWRSASRREAKA